MPHTEVAPQEAGKVRVYALSLSDAEARAMRDDETAQAAALGVDRIDAAYTEVFRVADLDQLGLAGYLRDGNGVNPDQIETDRSKLAALDGWVMIVYSRAFAGQSLQLAPIPALTHIGTYTEGGPDPVRARQGRRRQDHGDRRSGRADPAHHLVAAGLSAKTAGALGASGLHLAYART